MITPTESDWKHMKKIHEALLARLCTRINAHVRAIIDNQNISEYKKYIAVYKYIQRSDGIMADCFNDWRRSNILMKIASIKREKLFTEKEFEGLSEHIRNCVTVLLHS